MFINLFRKYFIDDIKNSVLSVFFAASGSVFCLICWLIAGVMSSVENEIMWCFRIIGGVVLIGAVFISIAILLYTNFRKYYTSVYGEGAYFTFSLPVSLVEILIAKVLSLLLVFLLFSFLCIGLAFFVILCSGKLYFVFSFFVAALGKTDYVFTFLLYCSMILFLIVSVFYALSVSGKNRKHREIKTVLTLSAGWIINLGLILISGLVIHFFFPYMFDWGTRTVFFSWLPSLIVFCVNIFGSVGLFLLLVNKFKKGIEI